MNRFPGVRALRFDEIWKLYLELPPRGDRETYLKLLEKRYGGRRKARETLNMLVLAGMLMADRNGLRKIRVNDRGELREVLVSRLFKALGLNSGIKVDLDGKMSDRARKAIKSTLKNLGALIPVRAVYLSDECGQSLAALVALKRGVRVRELREWAISKGYSDLAFKRCLISAIKDGLIDPPRPKLFQLWLNKGMEEPPSSISSDSLSKEERKVLSENEDLVSFDFQRGREVVTVYSLWGEDDLLISRLVIG